MGLHSKSVALAAVIASLSALALASTSSGEIARKGSLQASFSGGIAPAKLPRAGQAPVSVQMSGKITTTDRSVPPKLERIVLAINSHGVIDSKGLGTCSLTKLNAITSAQAQKTCADALVGHGNVTSRVSLPGQGAFASSADLLAFNGRLHGKPAVLAQVSSGAPLPLTYVIGFEVKKAKGIFGTQLVATLPPIASEYGYISSFSLALGRTYSSHGQKRSFASASCPAPAGFSAASFPFAKASYEFADGTTLSSSLVRECKVRN